MCPLYYISFKSVNMLHLVNNFKLKVTTVQILNQIKLTIVEQYDFEVIFLTILHILVYHVHMCVYIIC